MVSDNKTINIPFSFSCDCVWPDGLDSQYLTLNENIHKRFSKNKIAVDNTVVVDWP